MAKQYSLKKDGSFKIKKYNQTSAFSNFLPGIAGQWGIPLWVFYVNRAQGVVSFGIKDKDHAIAEFFPANKAYTFVPSLGFRTFMKVNGQIFYEPFRDLSPKGNEEMVIRSESLELNDKNSDLGLTTNVKYFTLSNTKIGGLVRVLKVKNTSQKNIKLDLIDGLSRIVPFGSANPFLKDMSRTLEAWMHANTDNNLATFRLIVDPRDVSQTKYIEGANFNYSFYEDKNRNKVFPYLIVDPVMVFGQDNSFNSPLNFLKKGFKIPFEQIKCGRTPCALSYFKWNLAPGQEKVFYSVFGAAFKEEMVKKFIKNIDSDFLNRKEKENQKIIEELKNRAFCVSGVKEFDNYIKSTYLDNVLRGGFPYRLDSKRNNNHKDPDKSIYYTYSRKHGDLERDYNNFQLLPSYFSEGNANYRDINQNRRMDLFFEPNLREKNIKYFLNLLKIDGYNPLVIKGEKLYINKKDARAILKKFNIIDQRALHLMEKGFHLGEFFKLLDEEGIKISRPNDLAADLLAFSRRQIQANHGEGYWIDHWHYNLDLIESFLYFYPDKLEGLFLEEEFCFWDQEYQVKPRSKRYVLRLNKVYQGESLALSRDKRLAIKERGSYKNFLRTDKGKIYKTNLVSKLLALVLNKAATLDPEGIGIEMEADKPGWCDSLNGLPALFGSSLCETLELKRAAKLLLEVIPKVKKDKTDSFKTAKEVYHFFNQLNSLLGEYFASKDIKRRDYIWWDKSNTIKESFREKTFFNVSSQEKAITFQRLEEFLKKLVKKLDLGIVKAKDKKSGLPLTYFTYAVEQYSYKNKSIVPEVFLRHSLPFSLEGVMHYLKVQGGQKLHERVKKSQLYDKKLKMYRLNAPLKTESLEIGRSRVFVPGWLENETIWLHMEYKYLIELLKRGLYKDFFTALNNCGVCFFDPKIYGRNILENSSFIVSSAFPDKKMWGRGFVARLSGATAEFINIWILLCLGKNSFYLDKQNKLNLTFSPILKKDFFTTAKQKIRFKGRDVTLPKNSFAFKLFSSTLVIYHNPKQKDTFDKNCKVKRIIIERDGQKYFFNKKTLKPPYTHALRDSKIDRVDVYFE